MVIALVAAAVVSALLLVGFVGRRRRNAAKARAQRDDEIRASLTDPGPTVAAAAPGTGSGLESTDDARFSEDPWSDVVDLDDESPGSLSNGTVSNGTVSNGHGASDDADPAGPPAAIRMVVSGTHPWAPARLFLTDLTAEGFEATVELPDLVVVRNHDRLPITVREPAGPPGQLMVTAPPELLADSLEILVRSLLASGFSLDATDGRDVVLTDDEGAEITLTVTELSRV